jgi:hypothetical protein
VESGLTLASESFVGAQKKWCYKNFDIPTSNTNICSAPAENRVCVCVHEQTIISAQEVAKLFKVGHSLSCYAAATLPYYSSAGPLLLL